MLLAYVDDTGNSWELKDNFFIDGPYVMHVGLLVNEEKYFHLERLFYELFSSILGVRDWRRTELHATKIWKGEGFYRSVTLENRKKYFAEFIQMLAKLSVIVVVGVQQKNSNFTSKTSQLKQVKFSQYAFLHALEHNLSEQNQTAVLISDEGDKILTLRRLLYERSQWRYNPRAFDRGITKFQSKFKYESLSCFILDQMHFVSSKDSLFIQIVDHVSYLLQRVFTYSYLTIYPKIPAQKDKVPVSEEDFKFFAKDLLFAEFDENNHDVKFSSGSDIRYSSTNSYEYLPDNWIRQISRFK